MIKSVADARTKRFLAGEWVKEFHGFERQAQRRLEILRNASCMQDLMLLPSNRFKALTGDRDGKYSIRINDRWRICFAFRDGDAHDVEIVDYHR